MVAQSRCSPSVSVSQRDATGLPRGGSRSQLYSFKRDSTEQAVASLWLEAGIDWFTLEGEDTEDAFMNSTQRLSLYKSL